uniref:Uncharacterized protein n=1 Tax=Cacopsylla melanoneura TaxID=428564 RepID=A0A8D9A0M7_9HEMI
MDIFNARNNTLIEFYSKFVTQEKYPLLRKNALRISSLIGSRYLYLQAIVFPDEDYKIKDKDKALRWPSRKLPPDCDYKTPTQYCQIGGCHAMPTIPLNTKVRSLTELIFF